MTTTAFRTLLACVLVTTSMPGTTSRANAPLALQVNGHYGLAPATVFMTVAVEPDSRNRLLRIEADGDSCFRASDVRLEGEREPRYHAISFKNLPAGEYTVRARLLAQDTEIAQAEVDFVVVGK